MCIFYTSLASDRGVSGTQSRQEPIRVISFRETTAFLRMHPRALDGYQR